MGDKEINSKDEGQFDVAEKDVEIFCEICEAAFPAVEKYLGFRCPLAGEAMVGNSWAETH